MLEQDKKELLLMMVIAGENMARKIFMDPRTLGKYIITLINFLNITKFSIFCFCQILKINLLCFVNTEDIIDVHIDSHEVV